LGVKGIYERKAAAKVKKKCEIEIQHRLEQDKVVYHGRLALKTLLNRNKSIMEGQVPYKKAEFLNKLLRMG
jgi:hypothetical protein